jgi:hypothetical protein
MVRLVWSAALVVEIARQEEDQSMIGLSSSQPTLNERTD